MSQKTPAIDFPKRILPLTGEELLIKQNKPNDNTPSPKEEMIPTNLISDLALNKIQGLSINNEILSLNIIGRQPLNVDLSSLSGNNLISAQLSGDVLSLGLEDNTSLNVDLSSLSSPMPSFYRSSNDPNNGFLFFSTQNSITTTVQTVTTPSLSTIASIYIPNNVRLFSLRYIIDPAQLGQTVTLRIYDNNDNSGIVYNATDFTTYYPSISFVSYLSYQQNTSVVPNFQYVTNPSMIGANIFMRRITNPSLKMIELSITGLNSPVQAQLTF